MEKETLCLLERVNQLALDEDQRAAVLAFFEKQENRMAELNAIDTVMPIMTVVREDVEKKLFTREDLQKGAPETMDGYWQVPRVVE